MGNVERLLSDNSFTWVYVVVVLSLSWWRHGECHATLVHDTHGCHRYCADCHDPDDDTTCSCDDMPPPLPGTNYIISQDVHRQGWSVQVYSMYSLPVSSYQGAPDHRPHHHWSSWCPTVIGDTQTETLHQDLSCNSADTSSVEHCQIFWWYNECKYFYQWPVSVSSSHSERAKCKNLENSNKIFIVKQRFVCKSNNLLSSICYCYLYKITEYLKLIWDWSRIWTTVVGVYNFTTEPCFIIQLPILIQIQFRIPPEWLKA